MLDRAIELAGFCGRIIVERALNEPSIERCSGYSFNVRPAIDVTGKFKLARIACIDGYIESVSELHYMLEQASETKEPCIMFARGMADDVKHTLKVNFDRASLKVVPIVVPFDLDGINTLNDLSIVTGP